MNPPPPPGRSPKGSAIRRPPRNRTQPRLILLVLLGLLGLALPACSELARTRPVLKIGLVAPFEGHYRYVGYDAIYAARLAVREANAAGGVAGYTVELVAYDDGGDPATARKVAQALALDDAVVAVIGHWLDETTLAAAPVYAEAGLPLLAPSSHPLLRPTSINAPEGGRRLRLAPPEEALATQATRLLAAQFSARRVLLWVQPPDDTARLQVWQQALTGAGIEAMVRTDLPPTAPLPPADALICLCDPLTGGEFLRAVREAGFTGPVVGLGLWADPPLEAIAGERQGPIVTVGGLPDLVGLFLGDFPQRYRAVGPHVPPPGPRAVLTYDAVRLVMRAIEDDHRFHGQATRRGVGFSLYTTALDGLTGHLSFDENGQWRSAPVVVGERGDEGMRQRGRRGEATGGEGIRR